MMRQTIRVVGFVALALQVQCVKRAEVDALKANGKALAERVTKLENGPTGSITPKTAAVLQRAADEAPGEAVVAPAPVPTAPDANTTYAIPIGSSAVHGPQDAWVTIVMFSDYQCPFCSRADATLRELEKKYPHDVRFVMKHNPLPFHPRAMPAALAAECAAQQNHFWPTHARLMDAHGALDDKQLEAAAKAAGVKVNEWRKCVAQAEPKTNILADQKLAISMGARGTPAFFINGRFMSGAQPLPHFVTAVEDALTRAKSSGLTAKEYYAKAVVKDGKASL